MMYLPNRMNHHKVNKNKINNKNNNKNKNNNIIHL